MQIAEILVHTPSLPETAAIAKAIALLCGSDTGLLPVTDAAGRLTGVLTTQRLLAALQNGQPWDGPVRPLIDTDPPTLAADADPQSLAPQDLPALVVDNAGAPIGVVTLTTYAAFLHRHNSELQNRCTVAQRELGEVKLLNKELEAIIDSSYDGIWITDGNGVILNINKASERISGRPAKTYIGRNMKELVDKGLLDQSTTLLVMEKRERVTINQTIKTANGDTMVVLATGNPVFDDTGNLYRIVTNTRDISELVRLRDRLYKEQELSLRYMAELVQLRKLQSKSADLIYRGSDMQRIVELSSRVADVDSTILITGESGTGKEMIARLIHQLGRGDKKPFIAIDCGAIPDQLLESELFGYEGGAFTGAKKEGKPGMFELAHTGTLFLDEVAELPLALQAKLLRVLQSKEVLRVGGTRPIPVDARIITATNKDLARMLMEKRFREDLYYRLMVVPIHTPPLRERREDIPPLVYHFVDAFNRHHNFSKTIAPEVMDRLVAYDWPGNVRELKNVVERMMVMSGAPRVTTDDLPAFIQPKRPLPKVGSRLKEAVAETETYLLKETYKEHKSWQKVAQVLGVDYTTVYRKVAKYHLTV
ncbi:sigma 54-interacting transcriptional regulator [Desulfatitalea alkaliphila]|uniref:HTH-type transcriptional regulatory protein TyrR n=1 Tax=Desulfatitalea alkaliphila TaxID=2929485 RepID=A0AA41UIW5_9BACT|nr:sigma 54-interacting transcriptional regulator [Desulfatitalea alkaliphila]MCJ8499962.1 sigma 54-interacting transcriptional regulator [Desulfatitalea alkaliphila]